jgi:trans-aconitate methyltransferase
MTEQVQVEQIEQNVSKLSHKEKSAAFVTCKLSYDCLLSSTKSFYHNFNKLTDEEKTEFKSLSTYIKQLEKCSIKNKIKVFKPKKSVQVQELEPVQEPVQESVQEPVQEPVQEEEEKKVSKRHSKSKK